MSIDQTNTGTRNVVGLENIKRLGKERAALPNHRWSCCQRVVDTYLVLGIIYPYIALPGACIPLSPTPSPRIPLCSQWCRNRHWCSTFPPSIPFKTVIPFSGRKKTEWSLSLSQKRDCSFYPERGEPFYYGGP